LYPAWLPLDQVGEQDWKVNFTGDSLYFANNSANFTLTINSSLFNYIVKPDGGVFSEGDIVYIEGNITDDCRNVSAATTSFRIYPGGFVCNPNPANNPNNGNYTCTWDSTSAGVGWRNMTMNSSKIYYHDGYYFKENAFQIRKAPVISNEQVNPDTEGWGYNFTFQFDIQDTDGGDAVNIDLWKSSGGEEWVYVGSTSCTSGECTGTRTKYIYSPFSCSDFVNGPIIEFKLNATDSYGLATETSNFSATLQRDNVTFTVNSGNGVSINRVSGSEIFNVTVTDIDRLGSPPVDVNEEGEPINGTFWFGKTAQVEDFDWGHSSQIKDGTGQMNYTFDPNCSYEAGIEYWYAEIHDAQCYQDTSMVASNQIYYLYGQLRNNLTLPVNGSQSNVTNQIPVNFTTLSDCSEHISSENPVISTDTESIELSLDGTSWEECTSTDSGSGWVNCSWDSTDKDQGWWDVRVNSSKQYFNDNSSVYVDRFYLRNWEAVNTSLPDVSPTQAGWSRYYNYSIPINDTEGDSITCSLFISRDNQTTWEYKGLQTITGTPGIPTTGICNVTVYDFSGYKQGTCY
jgi:hypothetical protein